MQLEVWFALALMLYDFFGMFFAFICLVEFDTRLGDFYSRVDDAVLLQKFPLLMFYADAHSTFQLPFNSKV